MEINGAAIVLTGASAGIGAATARLLGRSGARLVLAARRTDRLDAVAAELEAQGADVRGMPTDMRRPREVEALIATAHRHLGRIDVLINNAGISAICPLEKLPDETFQTMFELNVLGTLHAMQGVIPLMRTQGGGLIVNISSMVSRVLWPSLGGYAATKHALNCLSETVRVEHEKDNIRVSVVFPDNTGTDFGSNALLMIDPPTEVPNGGQWRVDAPELVAEKIHLAIRTEPPELYVR